MKWRCNEMLPCASWPSRPPGRRYARRRSSPNWKHSRSEKSSKIMSGAWLCMRAAGSRPNNACFTSSKLRMVCGTVSASFRRSWVSAAESDALENTLLKQSQSPEEGRHALAWIVGRRIVYVGGRPGSNAVLRQLVASAGGELTVHDGGVE